jgi:hypothetical protein
VLVVTIQQKLSTLAIFFACVAAMLEPLADHGVGKAVFSTLILSSVTCTYIGVTYAQRDYLDWRLQPERDNAWRYEKEAGL